MTWMLWKTEHGFAEEESEKIQMNYKWVNWEKTKLLLIFHFLWFYLKAKFWNKALTNKFIIGVVTW